MQIVMAGVQDPSSKTRGAAVFAIGQLSEHCQPETGQRAKEILPAVFSLVNDPDSEVQEQAHYALQTFCESLGEESVAKLPFGILRQIGLEAKLYHTYETLGKRGKQMSWI